MCTPLGVLAKKSAYFANVTSATITQNIILALLHLLGISNWSSFHQRPMDCMFSSKHYPDIETAFNESEFLTDVTNKWDNDNAIVYRV
jgi:L-rhamnose mutarotase